MADTLSSISSGEQSNQARIYCQFLNINPTLLFQVQPVIFYKHASIKLVTSDLLDVLPDQLLDFLLLFVLVIGFQDQPCDMWYVGGRGCLVTHEGYSQTTQDNVLYFSHHLVLDQVLQLGFGHLPQNGGQVPLDDLQSKGAVGLVQVLAQQAVMPHQLCLDDGGAGAHQQHLVASGGREFFACFLLLLLADFVHQVFAHFAIGGPFAPHQTVQSRLRPLYHMVSGNILRIFCLLGQNQRPEPTPPRLLQVNQLVGLALIHQPRNLILNELPLFQTDDRVDYWLLELALGGPGNDSVQPGHNQQNSPVRGGKTQTELGAGYLGVVGQMRSPNNADSLVCLRVVMQPQLVSPGPCAVDHILGFDCVFLAREPVLEDNPLDLPLLVLDEINKLGLIDYVGRLMAAGQELVLLPGQRRGQESSDKHSGIVEAAVFVHYPRLVLVGQFGEDCGQLAAIQEVGEIELGCVGLSRCQVNHIVDDGAYIIVSS